MALPPFRRTARPASVARGWFVTTAPRRPMMTGRHVFNPVHGSISLSSIEPGSASRARSLPVVLLPEHVLEDVMDALQVGLFHDERGREREDVASHSPHH